MGTHIMGKQETKKIRNVALLGHGGSGKTSLAEAMLYISDGTDRLGKTPDGNTVCDYDGEEIKRGFSLQTAIAPINWKDVKINVIDTPGYLDFSGEVAQGLRVADSAVIVIDGKSGIEVGTELAWDYATEAGIPKAFFINKFDDGEARFRRVFDQLHERFGVSVCPIVIPMIDGDTVTAFLDLIDMKSYTYNSKGGYGEAEIPAAFVAEAEKYREVLYEAIASTDEALMEKFFGGEEISREEAVLAIHEGILHGAIVPVICGAATRLWGVGNLLDIIDESFPRHTAKGSEKIIVGDKVEELPIETDGVPSIFVFKTIADPFVGKMSFFKVMAGELKRDTILKNMTSGQSEKLSHIYVMKGKKQIEVEQLNCGDIGMVAKLVNTNTNDTLTAGGVVRYAPIKYPQPYMSMAVLPAAKGDEDKISGGIARLLEEDLTLKFENNAETKQLVLSGMGDMHLDVTVAKLKSRSNVSVKLVAPKIPYRETITKTVQVEGKHKKQSGGHGQYGHVKITFKPGEAEGLTFTESTVGGSVPKNFHPAVEKGLLEAMQKGVAGYPVVRLAADLYDGSYHDVDSSEMSFKMAASLAYKECLKQAKPVILEPVGALYVTVPESMVGDVMGDLNKRRGRVMGMNPAEKKGYTVVEAEVPKAEMMDYTIALRASTQGRGSFTYEFVRYEEVPSNVAQKIIAEAEKDED